ncbi:MAG: hypothetical protein IPF93_15085 [Saprospiraceae bacterium]|nr:hypothetical protein [Saprospiraceae bacterium]
MKIFITIFYRDTKGHLLALLNDQLELHVLPEDGISLLTLMFSTPGIAVTLFFNVPSLIESGYHCCSQRCRPDPY